MFFDRWPITFCHITLVGGNVMYACLYIFQGKPSQGFIGMLCVRGLLGISAGVSGLCRHAVCQGAAGHQCRCVRGISAGVSRKIIPCGKLPTVRLDYSPKGIPPTVGNFTLGVIFLDQSGASVQVTHYF